MQKCYHVFIINYWFIWRVTDDAGKTRTDEFLLYGIAGLVGFGLFYLLNFSSGAREKHLRK